MKVAVLSNHLRPKVALVDPQLTMNCPGKVTADSGIDALTHAIEAYTAIDNADFPLPAGERSVYQGRHPLGELCAEQAINDHCSPHDLAQLLCNEAQLIADEDFDACMSMGIYGAELIADGDTLLTHCNAGALATAGWGTALAPMYVAHKAGKHIHVFVDETRPVLQGARLTAWELQQEGIPLTLITDNMVGHFMHCGDIKAVFVGADRIAANGDVANKIGTYGIAVLAQAHSIPFYVAAPLSTIDLNIPSGNHIPIEQRDPSEVTSVGGTSIAPPGILAANPAFDVTPHDYITAIITDRGIIHPPYVEELRRVWAP